MSYQKGLDGPAEQHDLTQLASLSEDDIVSILKDRYQSNMMYTRIGARILVAVNPRKTSESSRDLAISDYLAEYRDTTDHHAHLPPQIFQMMSNAYLEMRRTGHDQVLIFSGETASGKSLTKQHALNMLSTLRAASKKETHLMKQVMDAYSILNAFGNAKTIYNPDSSRFSNYTEIQFSEKGRVIGAKILDYLLEKSRVACTSQNEENFHVFRYLVGGINEDERRQLQLESLHFNYLRSNSGDTESAKSELNELRDALKSLGLNRKYQNQIFRLLAGILHLGNINFMDHPHRASEAASVKNLETLEVTANLLGVDSAALENVLTYKSQVIRKEICTVFLNAQQAEYQKNDLSKALYSLLFSWIVEFINTKLHAETQANFIGFVDMQGFQSHEVNSFDSFCVNFANERFHHFINHQIFEVKLEEYLEQGVDWAETPFFDNSLCVELLVKPNIGLIALMENQVNGSSVKLTDEDLLNSFSKHQSAHANYQTLPQNSISHFAIQHYAGSVSYQITNFVEKNNETIGTEFVGLFRGGADVSSTSNSFIAGLFSEKTVAYGIHPRNEKAIITAQQPAAPVRKPSTRRPKKEEKENSGITGILTQFKKAMSDLIETIEESIPWFVMCIRINEDWLSQDIDIKKVRQQVRYMGLAEMAKAYRVEYTSNMTHEGFLERYSSIVESMNVDQSRNPKTKCQVASTILGYRASDMAIGSTKVYLGYRAWRNLENNLRSTEEKKNAGAVNRGFNGLREDHTRHVTSSLPPVYPKSQSIIDTRSNISMNDITSFYSDDDYFDNAETDSVAESELLSVSKGSHRHKGKRLHGLNQMPEDEEKVPLSAQRKKWLCCTWGLTWWIPTCALRTCGRMTRPDIQIAWREKTTLCILISIMCLFVLFFLIFFGELICPRQYVFSKDEVGTYDTKDKPYVSIRGEVFTVKDFVHKQASNEELVKKYAGKDVSDLFPIQVSSLCDGFTEGGINPAIVLQNYTDLNAGYHDYRYAKLGNDMSNFYQDRIMAYLRIKNLKGQVAWGPEAIKDGGKRLNYAWGIINNMVYDLDSYSRGQVYATYPPNTVPSGKVDLEFMDPSLVSLFTNNKGEDLTARFNRLYSDNPALKLRMSVCLQNIFYVGVLDTRNSAQCKFSNYIILASSIFLGSILFFKFLAALQLGSRREPEDHDKFVVIQIPCYTEGEESLRGTLDSLAALKYDDKRKLLFIVADGMIIGGGNDRPTPEIVLDILGVDRSNEPEPLVYHALGEGNQQLNMAKIYTGLYACSGHIVPYIVIAKVGKATEHSRPGNRGKRDSQLVLMNFFNRIHFQTEMNPLELEMYHQIKNVIGVDPYFYEYVLMVDADTIVLPDSLNRMISCMLHDTKIMGICGETELINAKATFITMIQVYEYFISHHLNKAFESLFGSVTCLPGCFCMYRFRTPIKNQPLLIANCILEDYSENKVDTLHKKNLLSLGEDRYLTTLMLKHFNYHKMTFTPDAKCRTNAPDTWSVLLSQRRRWINSTIHNLSELLYLPRLCGFCCFSMRFVIFLDLLSTIIMPIQCIYLGYLVYKVVSDPSTVPLISIVLLACIYGFQVFIFILKRQWQHIGWMIVYLFSLPVFSMFLPIYAFWHFDDFSWGNTRVVIGEKGTKGHVASEERFDPQSIPLKKWTDYEQEIWEVSSRTSRESHGSSRTTKTYETYINLRGFDGYRSAEANDRSLSPGHGLAPRGYSQYSNVRMSQISSSKNLRSEERNSRGGYSSTGSEYGGNTRSRSRSVLGYDNIPPGESPSQVPFVVNDDYGLSRQPNHHRESGRSSARVAFSEEEILEEVRTVLSAANLMTITKKQVRDQISTNFGADLSYHKAYINSCIDKILQGKV
ncbi:hypothetical protein K7432_009877 [Basidiobolus ranarum]|uniref:chitin synthase n=1 Tax=Basidiobolus ranarum TaxID=34480 RepID=A0ABR2VWD7_9FUNG